MSAEPDLLQSLLKHLTTDCGYKVCPRCGVGLLKPVTPITTGTRTKQGKTFRRYLPPHQRRTYYLCNDTSCGRRLSEEEHVKL